MPQAALAEQWEMPTDGSFKAEGSDSFLALRQLTVEIVFASPGRTEPRHAWPHEVQDAETRRKSRSTTSN